MGESISEATIISWLKQPGDTIEQEETILEVATDKVDSEVPSPCTGILKEVLFQPNDVVPVGTVLALIDADESAVSEQVTSTTPSAEKKQEKRPESKPAPVRVSGASGVSDTFLSPLVISIAQKENLTMEEVLSIPGTGTDGRIRKSDVVHYLKNRKYPLPSKPQQVATSPASTYKTPPIPFDPSKDRRVEMDRMRQMIADHMVYSKHTSPHVTSYVEVDVTNLVNWRNKVKVQFQEKHGEKLTFTPIFVQAVAKAIQEFPLINVSVDGNEIVVKKDINVGMATALPSGNLIVPVVKNADQKNLVGLAKEVNTLAGKARENKLSPEDIQGSSFTISNVGTFGSLMGTPIINQPEVAILATGIIKKRAEVIERDGEDVIAIRQMMFLSLSFDHRVVDGFLGGSFLKRVADHLEQFDENQNT